ncbi:MAG: hypothetical protein CMN30_19465 [Sandaracinus sp.]|nr:hypothetical protein [Sandaracinus sp.]
MGMAACGTSTTETASFENPSVATAAAGSETEAATPVARAEAPADFILPAYSAEELAGLPDAPWSSEALAAADADAALLGAWTSAENNGWCAPLVPAGATGARASTLDGGWAFEFDQAGAPGVSESGDTCRRCGRSAFGVAGTSMPVDSLNDEDTDAAPAPTYADGSFTEIVSEDGVASATISVGGQGCVYQVWSFLGEDHLRGLIEGLRIVAVEPQAAADSAFAAR